MPLMPSIAAVSDVQDVRMIDLGVSGWRNPSTGELRPVAMIGIDPNRPSLQLAELDQLAPSYIVPITSSSMMRVALITDLPTSSGLPRRMSVPKPKSLSVR